MNERPTPETDAVSEDIGEIMGCMMVDKEFAQKLERERDEAQEDAINYYAKIGELTEERDDALAQIVKAECRAERFCQERDNLREAIIAALEENRHLADGDDCTLAKLKSAVPDWE